MNWHQKPLNSWRGQPKNQLFNNCTSHVHVHHVAIHILPFRQKQHQFLNSFSLGMLYYILNIATNRRQVIALLHASGLQKSTINDIYGPSTSEDIYDNWMAQLNVLSFLTIVVVLTWVLVSLNSYWIFLVEASLAARALHSSVFLGHNSVCFGAPQ